jgi:hypothetical protein
VSSSEVDVDRLENRLAGTIDGALHLLDCEGRMLGKADDVELTQQGDELVITAVLTGPAALSQRLGGRLGGAMTRMWGQLRVSEPDRTRPWRIDVEDIDRLDSALHLKVRRDDVLRRDRDGLRLGTLTGMEVRGPEGDRMGRVLDARFQADRSGRLALRSLIVGHGRPGSLLGYDRRADIGPWLVRVVVRWLHRHTVIADAADAEISWETRAVRLRSRPERRPDHALD